MKASEIKHPATSKYPETEQEFIQLLEDYNDAYRQTLPLTPVFGLVALKDDVYDILTEDFRSKYPESAWFRDIEMEHVGENYVVHSSPMLSTEKAYSVEALEKWFNRVEDAAKELHVEAKYKVTCKLDGFAGDYEKETLSTRGDGLKGNNITHILASGVTRPAGVEGRGEIVVSKTYFEEFLSNDFAHPRNMISSVTSDEIKDITKKALADGAVHFVPYTTLYTVTGTKDEILNNWAAISEELRNNIDYIIDGFVLECTVDEIKNYMGYNNHHYKWQIAFKERGETGTSPVIDIKLQVGRTGAITPVLAIEPIFLSGAVISNVTAHHMNNLRINKIGIGSVIEIIRSGEVIPKIENVLTEADYEMPTACPCCSSELVWDSHFLICTNHSGCSEQIKQTLLHFFSTLDNNDGFGGKTVSRLVDSGFDTLQKIYAMTEADFLSCGFGQGETANLIKALELSQKSKIEDWRFLAAFGIPNLGRGDSKKLLKNFPLDMLHEVTSDKLLAIKGYGDVTSVSIVKGIREKLELINIMRPNFNLEISEKIEIDMDSPFVGKKVVVTGTMARYSRKEIESFFTSKGAELQKKVGKNTQILVYGEKAGSKLDEAKGFVAKGISIEILTEDEFVEKYGL